MIQVRHLAKRFAGEEGAPIAAVNGISFQVPEGRFFTLLGPSGCGKTTTLRCIAGLEKPDDGVIYIGERVVSSPKDRIFLPPNQRDIGMVFQSYAIWPHMTVFENVAFPLRVGRQRFPEREVKEKVNRALATVQLDGLADRPAPRLSGGQQQRLALARALVAEPKVLLLDEPLSNLDAKLRVQTRAEISKLHQRLETTFIYVTHDQTEAMTMGTRIAVMKNGLLQQLDTPQKLYDFPANVFVAGFIGSPAMNFFDVRVAGTREDLRLDAGSFQIPAPPDRRERVAGYLGRNVVLGIRPEDIHDRNYVPGALDGAVIAAQVDVMEPMGSEIYLYLLSDKHSFIARVDPRSQGRPGKAIDVMVNLDHVHLFDKETEQALR